MSKKLVVFLGPPGSGKGSISQLCTQRLGFTQLSTGSICRKHVAQKSLIGQQIDFSMKSGTLIPDELVTQMVCDWFARYEGDQPVILDGYPRTLAQADALTAFLQTAHPGFSLVVLKFAVSDETVMQRLAHRYVCVNTDCQQVYAHEEQAVCVRCKAALSRRNDDRPETIKERLKVYRSVENDLFDFYARFGCMVDQIDVERSIEAVFADIERLVLG
ncbi:MAG: nucleoside monophosphate kinase [Candidatus Babeliales bacterium]